MLTKADSSKLVSDARVCEFGVLANLAGGAEGVEHAGNDLRSPGPFDVVVCSRLEQLRVGEDDAQLIIESMKQRLELRIHDAVTCTRVGEMKIHAGVPAGIPRGRATPALPSLFADEARESSGSRHSESAKMRIAPPAVRTYSTLPAEIQL